MSKNEEAAAVVNELLKNINNNYRGLIFDLAKEFGYTVPQLILMRHVYLQPEITIKELSQSMGLAKSTVSGIVDRLEARNAVVRIRDEADRRSVKVSLGPAMSELHQGLQLLKSNYMANLLDKAQPGDIEIIIDGLQKLNDLMESQK